MKYNNVWPSTHCCFILMLKPTNHWIIWESLSYKSVRMKANLPRARTTYSSLHPLPLIDPLLANVPLRLSICLHDSVTDSVPSLLCCGYGKKIQLKDIYHPVLNGLMGSLSKSIHCQKVQLLWEVRYLESFKLTLLASDKYCIDFIFIFCLQ